MTTKNYTVTNLVWDTDGDRSARHFLPTNDNVKINIDPDASEREVKSAVEHYLFDKYGYDVISCIVTEKA